MAEAGTGADIVHPNHERMSQSVSTLRTALLADGYTAEDLASMTKNDMVYADDLNLGRKGVDDRQDLGSPPYNRVTLATEVSGEEGTLSPAGAVRPANLAAMNAAITAVTADPETAWDEGSHVLIQGDVDVHWDGSEWADGPAPA